MLGAPPSRSSLPSLPRPLTAGFGILLLPLYWLGIMLQVFFVEDLVLAGLKKK